MSDTPQYQTVLKALYPDCTDLTLELRTFPNKGATAEEKRKAYALRQFVPITNGEVEPARVERFFKGCVKEKLNPYFGVSLRNRESRKTRSGTDKECALLTTLFLDVDFKHGDEVAIRKRIADFHIKPTLIVESGRGVHVYFVLTKPFYLGNPAQRKEAKRWLSHVAQHFAGPQGVVDAEVSGTHTVLRLPDATMSFNYKDGGQLPVTISGGTLQPVDLNEFVLLLGPPPQQTSGDATVSGEDPKLVTEGQRHLFLFRKMRSFKSKGLNKDEAIGACQASNTLLPQPLTQADVIEHLSRQWDTENTPEFDTRQNKRAHERPKLKVTSLQDVEEKDDETQFGMRLHRGAITLLVGEGGVGKGILLADIAARFSRGDNLPDQITREGFEGPCKVAVLLTEDANSKFRKRVRRAQGALDNIKIICVPNTEQGVEFDGPVFFDDDLAVLTEELETKHYDVLVIETLIEHMGNRTGSKLPNTSNEFEVREKLAKLRLIIEKANVYCICTMHPRKNKSGPAKDHVSGSAGFTNVARSMLFLNDDPDSEDMKRPVKLLSSAKSNYNLTPDTLRFNLKGWSDEVNEPCGCKPTDNRAKKCTHTPRTLWFEGEELFDDRSANEVVEATKEAESSSKSAPQKEMAEEFLQDLLDKNGGWFAIPTDELDQLGKGKGITPRTLGNARRSLGLKPLKQAKAGPKNMGWSTAEAYSKAHDSLNSLDLGDEGATP